jgi:arylsulfatase A-like enzyme
MLNGPSGKGVDDLYTPEIAFNATISDLTKTKNFDELRVVSILNEIGGKDHTGAKTAPVPTLFGMNFQAINAAKKISGTSGYTDHIGTPDALLADALSYTDNALRRMMDALGTAQLLDSTLIIVTAKHGETPLDPPRTIILTNVIPNLLNGALGAGSVLKATEKSNAIIWLKNQSNTLAAANLIDNNRAATGVGQIFALESLKLLFPDPLLDPAVPDIIVTPGPGVNYEPAVTSTTKAEHGGLGENETHVPLIVSNAYLTPARIQAPVNLTQIAPTILDMLRYDPNSLDAVRLEGTAVLPNLVLKVGSGN